MKLKNALIIIFMLSTVVNTTSFGDEVLSKGEAIDIISATKFLKEKIGSLLSWSKGYDISAINRVKLIPIIKYIKAVPKSVPPDGRTVLEISAAIDDPEGLSNIKGVTADLTNIGRLKETILVDTGLWGDQTPNDGIYTMQTNINPDIPLGNKEITVKTVNKKGWLALSKTTITVDRSPKLKDLAITPPRIKAGENTQITISVTVISPNKNDMIKEVFADLREIAQGEKVNLQKIGYNKFYLDTVVPSIVQRGQKRIIVFAVNYEGETGKEYVVLEVIPPQQ
ncbi:hypothetical protein A2526_04955 [candidate division WOR-1 bacterium RIFOXYD2_FULL_36_8]|uniref:Uncharacterized protein n=1 Tax=candidate division WOR-1 bacterium RIFOXYB2_FULL_36_35 TaxID=1802578 RepID=A0A1F4S4U9_UNCSA|nr:MAG: hypothetical protein A2230_07525 [candidate division WOR-1 bacterium RIFOXYA2_FULL_36_21]OGC14763.1 MAG: hypothetical protein A2290_08720 [candidate division WOR-1 bacterium RIFOXYB2_FULL_36_35]OGC15453.1 MAG: hypothetical protein A2282_07700 [candidate division WOR-1 bacterium RIFOXYA12_FULL_36_13]OGC38785.1 MAG: hypothetical protein A2526_04955 [candidate division WOR-1 bacterium RIFOXYD2_FULL_36_8]